jgi:hypothetical protein
MRWSDLRSKVDKGQQEGKKLMIRHVGDGNVHSLALFNTDSELAIVREAVHEMVHRAIELDGTCSGEHGVGLGKVEYLESELGQGTVGLMESLKRTSKSPPKVKAEGLSRGPKQPMAGRSRRG